MKSEKSEFFQLLDLVEKHYVQLDAKLAVAAYERGTVEGMKSQCSSCTHAEPGCCYQKNIATFYEALPIARYIKDNNLDTPEFRERLRVDGEDMEAADREVWFHEQRRPCVFLKGGRCSIYKIRPIQCRLYHVVTPPELCQPGVHDGIASIDFGQVTLIELDRAKNIHAALRLKETRMRILMGALPRLVLIALEVWDSDDYQATIRSHVWPTESDVLAGTWVDGEAYRERLYQIRKKAETKAG